MKIKRKIHMTADELEVGMLVHPPAWDTTAPDRVAPIIKLDVGKRSTNIKVDGADPWHVRNDDYVTVVVA